MHTSCRLPEPPETGPANGLRGLQSAQQTLSRLGEARARTELVTLTRAVGRIAAVAVNTGTQEASRDAARETAVAAPAARIAAGTRLDVRHLPLLCAAGAPVACVFERVRVGVITFARGADERTGPGAPVVGTTLAGLVEQLGAQAFEATCRPDQPDAVAKTLDMFLGECDLVLLCGFMAPAQCAIVRACMARRDDAAAIDTLRIRPIGTLQLAAARAKIAVALSSDLREALGAFVLLLSPLIRGLQGRGERVPRMGIAPLVGSDDGLRGLALVRAQEDEATGRIVLQRCADAEPAAAFATASGFAWRPDDGARRGPRDVAYYPFADWLS